MTVPPTTKPKIALLEVDCVLSVTTCPAATRGSVPPRCTTSMRPWPARWPRLRHLCRFDPRVVPKQGRHRAGPGYPPCAPAATFRAASGPWLSSSSNPASESTGTPNWTALSYFDPGLSPATTKSVFFDTDPVTFPPRSWTASFAESLLYPSSDPVMTTVTPASGRGPPAVSSAIRTPAARHFATISACQSTANQ